MNTQFPGRIAILTNTYPPEFGAAPARIHRMAKGLQEAGFEVEVLTGMPSYPLAKVDPKYRNRWKVREAIEGIRVIRHWVSFYRGDSKWGRFRQMFSLAFSIASSLPYLSRHKPDWIIVQYPPIALPMLSILFKKILGCRLIVNFSDLWPFAMADLGVIEEGSSAYRVLEYIEKGLYKNADAFLAQSEEVGARIREFSGAPLMTYRTGAEIQDFPPGPAPTAGRQKGLKLVYAGVMGMAHGLLDLCRNTDFSGACAELHIYGDGLEKPGIASWKKAHPEQPVFLHHPVPSSQVPEVLAEHHAMIIPQKTRIRGTVPSKIYEAMAIGMPIVFIGGGEGAALIERCGCGYTVAAGDYRGLEQAIKRLCLLSLEERRMMGQAGRREAEQYFDRKEIVGQMVGWLKSLSQRN